MAWTTDRPGRQAAQADHHHSTLPALPTAGFCAAAPGLVRMAQGGAKIEVEVWELPLRHYGTFVAMCFVTFTNIYAARP